MMKPGENPSTQSEQPAQLVQQQNRPAEPHFGMGRLGIMGNNPMETAHAINYNSDNRPVLPRLPSASSEEYEAGVTKKELKEATNALRERFMKSVKAAAKAANPNASKTVGVAGLDPADVQRASMMRDQRTAAQDNGPLPANAVSNDVAPHSGGQTREDFTSPGMLLNQHEDLLTENHYASTRVLQAEHSKQFKQDFRRYYEKKRDEEERMAKIATSLNDKLGTNNYPTASNAPSTSDQPAQTAATEWLTNPNEIDRLNKPRITYQLIDSNNRNKLLYPNPNNYVIELGRRFSNVKRVKLISSEIPNTAVLIRDDPKTMVTHPRQYISIGGQTMNDSNKHMYWINEEDSTIPGSTNPYDSVVYDGSITPGNYSAVNCECDEQLLETQMEQVAANINRFVENTPHQFQVTINAQTNVVSILSLQSQLLSLDPIQTTAGSNKLIIRQINHGYHACQTQRVTITGSTSVGGIPDTVINDSHTIIAIQDPDHFIIRVTTLANQTVQGGGANVFSGIGAPFMLLASNIDTPFSSILGFLQQDSSEHLAESIGFINTRPPNLMTTDPFSTGACTSTSQTCFQANCCTTDLACQAGVYPAWICSANHGLAVGDQILINDTDTIPPINGLQTVTSIINANTFEIGTPIKVVNNQITTSETVLGCIVQSLDPRLYQITKLTLPTRGSVCTQYPHDLGLLTPNNTVWIGNVIGGLNGAADALNGIQIVSEIIDGNCFNIANGILFAGTDHDNAYIVKTTSTHKVPISYVEPANNGRFTPAATVPIYTGTSTPEFVLFQNTDTVPNINSEITVDVDVIGVCENVTVKNTNQIIWQTFVPTETSKLVSIYIRVGEGLISDLATLSIFRGDAAADYTILNPFGPNFLGTGGSAFVSGDVCLGTQFCLPSIPVTAGQKYTWKINLISRQGQTVALCYGSANPYPDGQCDLGPGLNYEFRTFMTPGIQDVFYYSQTTGKFTLTTVIDQVNAQNPNQSYIRSIDGNLRCIQDAFINSNGTWTFETPHGLAAGDEMFVNIITSTPGVSITNSTPIITPNVAGILTVSDVIDTYRLSTTTQITSSSYTSTGSPFTIEVVKTFATTNTSIANIYPQSSGYLCKQSLVCDSTRAQCVICPDDIVIVRGGPGDTPAEYNTDILQYDNVGTLLGNVYGCYTLQHVFNNVSTVCDSIFDFDLSGGRIDLPPGSSNLGEVARLDTSGGVDGRNGTFGVARVFFTSELCTIGVDAVSRSTVTFTQLPEFIYANAAFSQGSINRQASILPPNPFSTNGAGVLTVTWPNHGRAPGTNAFFCISRADPPPSGESNPPAPVQQIGTNGWSVLNINQLIRTGHGGFGVNSPYGGVNVIGCPVSALLANPSPTMHWRINTPTVNYYVWYQMQFPSNTARGTRPSGGIVSGRSPIPTSATVGIVLNVTDEVTDIALKTAAALQAAAPTGIVIPVTISGDTITIENVDAGASIPHTSDGAPPMQIVSNVLQIGSVATTTPTQYVNSLSVQSYQPHLLNAGDAVYIINPDVCAGNPGCGCQITTSVFTDSGGFPLPQPIQNIHNSLGFVVPDPTDASVFQIFGLTVVSGITNIPTPCQTPLTPGIIPIIDKQIYYHKICGAQFSPIIQFYSHSYSGMIESIGHGLTGSTNPIYIGQTSVSPNINGCNNANVIDENFFSIDGPPVVIGSTSGSGAGYFVSTVNQSECGGQCFPLKVFSITESSTGVIVAPNSFLGNECLYFLNDTNINLGSSNELKNRFFTVTAIDSTRFSLNVPIETIGSVFGDTISASVGACQTLVFNTPKTDGTGYCFIAESSIYEVQMSGGGGGNGLNYTDTYGIGGSGGNGGRVFGTITVNVGEPVYVYVGGAGESGKFNEDSKGGANGGGNSQSNGGATGNGGGGGASDIRIGGTGLANRIVIAGGGGGGTGYFPALNPLFSDPSTAIAQLQVGYRGGDGGGSSANKDGTDGFGNAGPGSIPPYQYYGRGSAGTTVAGGQGGYETALMALHTANAGVLGQGGGNNAPFGPIPIGNQAGGGGGYYGGGAGFVFSGDTAFIAEGGGGGGSSYFPSGCDGVTGGGSTAGNDGYVILRPLNIAIFTTPGTTTFQVPTNAVSVTIAVYGGYGGTGGTGPVSLGIIGGEGGVLESQFNVGGTSQIQPGTILTLTVGGPGGNGADFFDAIGSMAIGGVGGGGNGPLKTSAISDRGVSGAGGGMSMVQLPGGAVLIAAGGGGGGGGGGSYYTQPGAGGRRGQGSDAVNQIGSGGTLTQGGATGGAQFQGGSATGNELVSGGGGGGGYFGGGAGSVIFDTGGNPAFGSYAGGGGSGYLTSDGETYVPTSVRDFLPAVGYGQISIEWSVASPPSLPMGHYVQVPCLGSCDPCSGQTNTLSLIEEQTNGIFTSTEDTGMPLCSSVSGNGTCIFLTTGIYTESPISSVLTETLAYACPFETPSPLYSLTKFETNIQIAPSDIDPTGGLGGNNVDDVATADLRYPQLNGLGWIYATDCLINPVISATADSDGTFSPVSPGLQVGDSIYIDSIHPTNPDLNGVHVVSYIDVGNVTPQFFELANTRLVDIDGPIADGNIWFFKTSPVAGNVLVECKPINAISDSCPTELTVADHGLPIGEFVNLFIQDSETLPSINSVTDITSNINGLPVSSYIDRDIITGVFVVNSTTLRLPTVDAHGNSLCNITTLNDTFTLVQPRGVVARQILSTNGGCASITADPANNRTIITTPTRVNVDKNIAFPIISNVPKLNGSSIITVDTIGLNTIWNPGTQVTITGQVLGDPYVGGQYKIFNVTTNSFEVLSGSGIFSVGGTGGYVSGPAPPTVPGHGLRTGDLVKFGPTSVADKKYNLEDKVFPVTVIDFETFTIDTLINQPDAIGSWYTNWVNAEIPNHGLVDGDIFFLYGAGPVGGLLPIDLNTVHGEKRFNIPTQVEIETRKIVRVVDDNNVQFLSNYLTFPTVRTLGGGYQISISARNHLYCETVSGLADCAQCYNTDGCPRTSTVGPSVQCTGNVWNGPVYRNYGFNELQTNLDSLGQNVEHFLNFSADPFVILSSQRLTTDDINPVLNTGAADDVFSKIQLTSEPGDVSYNSYIAGDRIFYEPIARLDSIDFQWFRADGKPFDFRGREHSFTLQIEEYVDRLRVANKSSRRGINDAGQISAMGLVEATISKENPVQNLAGAFSPSQFAPKLSGFLQSN